jgi:hypothetical protein
LNPAGWASAPSVVTFSGTDESGIFECTGAVTVADAQPSREIVGSCTDNAGNIGLATLVVGVDSSRPFIVGPKDGIAIEVMKAGALPFQCRDDNSGVDNQHCEIIATDPLYSDFTVPGRKIFQVRATDRAGNTELKNFDFTVGNFGVGEIYTIAGNGDSTFSGDGLPANAVGMGYPQQVIPGDDASLFISDNYTGVLALDPLSKTIKNLWGYGSSLPVAIGSQGDVIYYSTGSDIRRHLFAEPDGIDARIAGGGYPVSSLVPESWKFSVSGAFAIDAKGDIYFYGCRTDSAGSQPGMGCAQLLKTHPQNGAVELIAGTGIQNFSGDGGLATLAEINQPLAISVDLRGNVYFYDGSRIRRIDVTSKVITTTIDMNALPAGGGADFLGMAFDGRGNGYFLVKQDYFVHLIWIYLKLLIQMV